MRFDVKTKFVWQRFGRAVAALVAALVVGSASASYAAESGNGLAATFTSGQATDATILSNVWLYVPAGQPPTPFLPAGKFQTQWRGTVAVDLRSDFTFTAELSGSLKVEVNGVVALEGATNNGVIVAPKRVRLNKGTNAIVATYVSPDSGDARVRLTWIPKDGTPGALPADSLLPAIDEAVERGQLLRLGRQVAFERRCFHCHATGGAVDQGAPELKMDAPSFEGIGSRRNTAWMAQWILDPQTNRAHAQMPRIFHGEDAAKNSRAAAAFLSSLKETGSAAPVKAPTTGQVDAGRHLFDVLHCAVCHSAPDIEQQEEGKIPLRNVQAKFPGASLVEFLKKPEAHYAWIQMPNFKFTDEEASSVAAFLTSKSAPAPANDGAAQGEVVAEGRRLVETSGCLNCHSSKLENKFTAPGSSNLAAASGCLADTHAPGSKAPRFALSQGEREAVRAFMATDRKSATRHVPAEFAARHSKLLNCTACHGQFEEFPRFDILGGKLKPEWSEEFIAGKTPYKPRPWIESRMPAFPVYAAGLAQGMAMQHGYPPVTPKEAPIDEEAAKVGHTLISAIGGFSCVSCHAVGEFGATQVFESAGINLLYSNDRLLPQFYHAWVKNPLAIDPLTKMPVYFDDEGNSPLTDVYDGSAAKQIQAMWEYIRLEEKMPAPKTE